MPARLEADPPEGVEEIAPGLVSVLVRTKPGVDFWRLSGEVRLRLGEAPPEADRPLRTVEIAFDGEDLPVVAELLNLSVAEFIALHNTPTLRVLATGFAPGFVYCGFHSNGLIVPRREQIRPMVPAGTVLFAAGQTAITATRSAPAGRLLAKLRSRISIRRSIRRPSSRRAIPSASW